MFDRLETLLAIGGPTMWAILGISIVTMATIIYKLIDFTAARLWSVGRATPARIIRAQTGLRILEISATVAPLLGLLGTVLGMITAFRALAEAGGAPEVTALAGGIWQALATTAAGMVVSIIATVFLGLFDGAVARLQAQSALSGSV